MRKKLTLTVDVEVYKGKQSKALSPCGRSLSG